jgi:proteasome assembly chaperone (PAC2) family protein
MFSSSTVCIGGLPGIGSVGKVAADYLATALECRTVMPFLSPGFPAQVAISDNLAHLLYVELKVTKDRENLFVLSGDAQPLSVRGMYRLAGEILEALKSRGITDIITLAACVGDGREKVVGVCSDAQAAEELEKAGIPLLRGGAIGGINGLLAGQAPLYGMRGFCLLGTTSGEEPVDLRSADNLLHALRPLLELDVDISGLVVEPEEEVFSPPAYDMYYR